MGVRVVTSSVGKEPARARMLVRTLGAAAPRCRITATAAGKSRGNARNTELTASRPPPEPPMTTRSRVTLPRAAPARGRPSGAPRLWRVSAARREVLEGLPSLRLATGRVWLSRALGASPAALEEMAGLGDSPDG